MVVLLGATAAQSLLGAAFRVTTHRGQLMGLPRQIGITLDPEPQSVVTVHPSAVLRDRTNRQTSYKMFVEDLRRARTTLAV